MSDDLKSNNNQGLVIIYTGEGKGKTTAALGLSLRAAGYNKKVLIVQFGKANFSGEVAGIKKLKPNVKIIQGGKGFVGILGDKLPLSEHKKAAQDTLKILAQEIKSGKWDVVISDEIIGAIKGKLITLTQVIKLIKDKPMELDLILTGRFAPQKLIDTADLVTEMKMIKHPFEKGILAKKGIDF
ncbi:cob(I)yrinic acid a,c-diamide adenosyltransferase [Candidatus Daviesbacteria bacterium]|nr:cob(I)yrinic acid a,c-diamide adenosyltransferase [Candidatus Daviesbacteria bacterium]